MHFKLEYTIREFPLRSEELLLFDVQNIHSVQVKLRSPNKEEQKIGHKWEHAFCTAQIEHKPSSKNEEIFEKIENNSIIKNEDEWRLKYKNQNDQEIFVPSISEFPEHFISYLNQIDQELSAAIRLIINALRWRIKILGPHNPISMRGLSWSRDKVFWHPAPSSHFIRFGNVSSTDRISKEVSEDVKEIIKSGTQEPVHHELFREAWEQKDQNGRSSLIIGLSALEVAVKTTIGTLIPNTNWLVENIPSPPVSRLLTEYLPMLPVVNTVGGKVLPPPKTIMELIKKAVTIRNRIAHIGAKAPSNDILDEILYAIQDTLWLLDYYCGHSWAYEHISKATRLELEC